MILNSRDSEPAFLCVLLLRFTQNHSESLNCPRF
ncbi:hypothetical protein X975_20315, partial [Stegodyphus mimosarum]